MIHSAMTAVLEKRESVAIPAFAVSFGHYLISIADEVPFIRVSPSLTYLIPRLRRVGEVPGCRLWRSALRERATDEQVLQELPADFVFSNFGQFSVQLRYLIDIARWRYLIDIARWQRPCPLSTAASNVFYVRGRRGSLLAVFVWCEAGVWFVDGQPRDAVVWERGTNVFWPDCT